MFVVNSFERLPVVGLHEFAHHFHGRFSIAQDDGDRLGVASEITAYGVRLLLENFSRANDAHKYEGNIELGNVQDLFETQFLSLKNDGGVHEPGGGVASLKRG